MYIILVYDIQVERVAKVCKYLRQHLNWIQNSVFEGQLTKAQMARVKSGLAALTNPEYDSIIRHYNGLINSRLITPRSEV